MLSYLVTCAGRTRELLRRALVAEDAFTDSDCRAAFLALMRDESPDDTVRLEVAQRCLPALADNDSIDAFIGLSANIAAVEHDVLAFAEAAILRDNADAIRQLLVQNIGMPPEFMLESQQKAIEGAQARIAALRTAFASAAETAAQSAAISAAETAADDPLLHVPGFVDELADFTMRTAQRPNRALSFAGALAMLAHLAARKFVGPSDARPNIYLVALADSGVGKEWPRKVNRQVAITEGMQLSVQGDISSGQGLEDALVRTPALLMQMDEFDTVLNVMKDEKASRTATEAMWKVMLSMFSSSGSVYTTRLKAVTAKGGGGGELIYNPSLSIFATAVPSKFYGALSERALDNGFLARCLVLEAGARGEYNPDAGIDQCEMPESLLRRLRHLTVLGRRISGNFEIDPRDVTRVPFADGAADAAKAVNKEADALYDKASADGDGMAMSVWNRSLELVLKLALLRAISEGVGTSERFAISRDAVEWAWRFVKSLQLRMLEMVAENTAANPLDEKVQRVLRLVRKAGKKGMTRSILSKKAHLSAKEMDEIESTLIDRDDITVTRLPRGPNGLSTKLYIAVKGK